MTRWPPKESFVILGRDQSLSRGAQVLQALQQLVGKEHAQDEGGPRRRCS